MSKSEKISHRVINLRKAMGLSQEEFAQQVGVSRNYVSMIEGGREPSKNIVRLIEVLEAKHLPGQSNPQNAMRRARLQKGLSFANLAKLTRYSAGVLQAVEEGHGQASEKMIEAISKVLQLDKEALMAGSEEPVVREPMNGTYGAKPPVIAGPGVGTPRYVPMISMAQAGTMTDTAFSDGGYTREGTLAFDVKDTRAFGVTVRGDSMSPQFNEGDIAIVYPSWAPRNGDLVICRLSEEVGGDVMFKLYSTRDNGRRVVLSSYNPAFPPVDYERQSFHWIYPVVSVMKTLRR